MGRALMGKNLDAEIEVETPQGKQLLYIIDIEYERQK
jgi:transcription elongation GreA/GreB family factor